MPEISASPPMRLPPLYPTDTNANSPSYSLTPPLRPPTSLLRISPERLILGSQGASPRLIPRSNQSLTPHPDAYTLLHLSHSPQLIIPLAPDRTTNFHHGDEDRLAITHPTLPLIDFDSDTASASDTLTARPPPAILGSQQSTLRPARWQVQLAAIPPLPTPISDTDDQAGGMVTTWQETESQTARPPHRPPWIGSLGEVKMVDELEVEMCVLCGRERLRGQVEVREFQLGVEALLGPFGQDKDIKRPNDDVSNVGTSSAEAEATALSRSGGDQQGIGQWMICKDTSSCDRAVEMAMMAEDED